MDNPTIISTWSELANLPESETHTLKINDCNGWILPKDKSDKSWIYLSTHTFYGSQYKESTRLLCNCGFNVTLTNWDSEKI